MGLHQPLQFVTTTGSTHDRKFHESPLLQPAYRKAPSLVKVHYVEDAISTVRAKIHQGRICMCMLMCLNTLS